MYVAIYLNAKQKHMGCKKVRGQSEAALQQVSVTKTFDISWGQEVTLSKMFLLLEWFIIFSQVYDWLCHLATFIIVLVWKRQPSDKANHILVKIICYPSYCAILVQIFERRIFCGYHKFRIFAILFSWMVPPKNFADFTAVLHIVILRCQPLFAQALINWDYKCHQWETSCNDWTRL